MVAIVRLNPQDFVNGNINRMNQGAILRLPNAEDISDISITEANEIVSSQISAWREQSTQSAPPPKLSEQAVEPLVEVAEPVVPATDQPAEITDDALARITDDRLEALNDSATEAAAEPVVDEVESGGLLELVPPAEEELAEIKDELPGSASGNDIEPDEISKIKLENRLATTEEDLVAAQEQNAHLQDQMSKMQAEIEALREGLNLNDNELAAMQQQMATDTDAQLAENVTNESTEKKQSGTRMLEKEEKSLLERLWWLGLLLLAGIVGFFVYRGRHNVPAETQAETNFLDSMIENKDADDFKGSDIAREESLAADAERILAVLEEGDAEVEEKFEAAHSEVSQLVSEDTDDAEKEAEEIKKFLDQVEADKATMDGSSDDALDHVDVISTGTAQAEDEFDGSAEVEILDSLESDDDSDSEQAADPVSEDQIETKLDLARAYLAMEDKPAAQLILDEIMIMGSEQQQLEARSMLDEIGE